MSKMAKPAGPSLAPEFAMFPAGSRVGISPALSQVMLPPVWRSVGGAVLVVEPTLPPTCGALVRLWLGLAITALLFLAVVVVTFLAVVVVPPTGAVVVAPTAVVVVSPATVVVVSSDVDVELPVAAVFLLPPPHAAATSPMAATTTRPRMAPDLRGERDALSLGFRSGMPVLVIDPPDPVGQRYCVR